MLVSLSWAKLLKSLKTNMPSPLPTIFGEGILEVNAWVISLAFGQNTATQSRKQPDIYWRVSGFRAGARRLQS